MARGRMLNHSISRSVKFDLLPDDTCRLMATWIISHLDMRGVFYGDPIMVKSLVFPSRADVTVEQVKYYLDQMQEIGLIILFESNNRCWQYWPGFNENQVGLRADREKSDFPEPPNQLPPTRNDPNSPDNTPPDIAGNLPEKIRQGSTEMPAEVEDEVEVEVEIEDESDSPPALDPEFAELCQFMQENIGLGVISSATISQEIQDYLDLYGLEFMKQAVLKSHDKNAKSWRYVQKTADTLASKGPDPPISVKICQQNGGYPPKSWWDTIDRKVGTDETKLMLLAEITNAWIGFGYKPSNIAGILDCFDRREIPTQNRANKNGTQKTNHQARFRTGEQLDLEPTYDPYTNEIVSPDGTRQSARGP